MSRPSTSKNHQIAQEIASKLGETGRKPCRQIENIVSRCGIEFSQKALADTLEIEANGGMMIRSGDRRRTLGGVFFYLVRQRMPEEFRDEIFYTWRVANKRRAQYESQFPAFEWEQRTEFIERLKMAPGKVEDVNIQLIGRPGEIERREHLVVTTMDFQFSDSLALPTGVPNLPSGSITYTVYISARQWERVASVSKDSDDVLVIDGYVAYDKETDSMAVYTTFATTRKLRRKDNKQGRRDTQSKKIVRNAPNRVEKNDSSKTDEHEELAPVIELDLPDDIPQDITQKLTELHTAAASFRQKISNLESKPVGQQFGLEMTQKLLKNTEQQIEKLEQQHLKS